ncbi:hypothetical protein CEXT_21821 [Caerostris extrusa]|uniref:Uncharacterized protein n=1 Tax=Caerostris extrusa TaxID=172846 RepID=A0AAV4T354_CAEEX|nr:hypothetical protein CEXT_21821 [Caerostris extrusa]
MVRSEKTRTSELAYALVLVLLPLFPITVPLFPTPRDISAYDNAGQLGRGTGVEGGAAQEIFFFSTVSTDRGRTKISAFD